MAIPRRLFYEVIVMAFDTVRTNKMRSGLTVLGIVIGITAIVGMTSLIRGFDQSLRDLFATIGPNTIFVQRFGITDFANGAEIRELLKRPNLTVSDARALEAAGDDAPVRRHRAGRRRRPAAQQRVFYRNLKTQADRRARHLGVLRRRHAHPVHSGPLLQRHRTAVPEERRRARHTARTSCCSSERASIPIGKTVRDRRANGSRSSARSASGRTPGGFNVNADDFVVDPAHDVSARLRHARRAHRQHGHDSRTIQIAVVPRDGVTRRRRWTRSSRSCAPATA